MPVSAGAPRQRVGKQLGVLAQLAVAGGQALGQRPLVLARQPRAVAQHAGDDRAPLVGRALHADEGIALLVAEGALQSGSAACVSRSPRSSAPSHELAGLASAQLHGVGLGLQDHARLGRAGRQRDREVLVAGLAHQVLHRLAALGELDATGGIAEARDLGQRPCSPRRAPGSRRRRCRGSGRRPGAREPSPWRAAGRPGRSRPA